MTNVLQINNIVYQMINVIKIDHILIEFTSQDKEAFILKPYGNKESSSLAL